jgi:hypothetical protein
MRHAGDSRNDRRGALWLSDPIYDVRPNRSSCQPVFSHSIISKCERVSPLTWRRSLSLSGIGSHGGDRFTIGQLARGSARGLPRIELPLNPANTIERYGPRVHLVTARSSGANEIIPSRRHRAKTVPREQSIRFPSCNLTCKRKRDWSINVCLTSLLFTRG